MSTVGQDVEASDTQDGDPVEQPVGSRADALRIVYDFHVIAKGFEVLFSRDFGTRTLQYVLAPFLVRPTEVIVVPKSLDRPLSLIEGPIELFTALYYLIA